MRNFLVIKIAFVLFTVIVCCELGYICTCRMHACAVERHSDEGYGARLDKLNVCVCMSVSIYLCRKSALFYKVIMSGSF